MPVLRLWLVVIATLVFTAVTALAQPGSMQGMGHGMAMPMDHPTKMQPSSVLKPAMGASVKILSPKPGQVFSSDQVPLQFKLVKGQVGSHVHAYVDGELMGMFETDKGTLTGIKPGQHTLELRVATADHQSELNATDTVQFAVK